MAIPTCQKGEKTAKFGDFSSDDEALGVLRETDAAAGDDALCREPGTSSYRAVLKKIAVAPAASASGDPKSDLIFRILDKQNSLLSARMQLEKDRADLAATLKTRSGLKEGEGTKATPTEKLLLGALSAAASFGVVTELFKDGAVAAYLGYLALRGGGASSSLIHGLERYTEMRRLASEQDLCGPLQGPEEAGEYAKLWKRLAGPAVLSAAAVFGSVALSKAFGGGGKPQAVSEGAGEGPVSAGEGRSYRNEELQKMDLSRLREIDSDLSAALSSLGEERQKVLAEAREVYRDIFSLSLGELKKRDLDDIKDDVLRAKAREILASGGGKSDPSFLERLGVMELAGIGIGFGVGTGVLHRFYNGVAPWRDFIDRRMNKITSRAREDAAKRIEELAAKGVLSRCSEDAAPEKGDLSFLYWDPATGNAVPDGTMETGRHFRDFTEADYRRYLESMVPTDFAETVDWKSVPRGLVSFLSSAKYEGVLKDDQWKWQELAENAKGLLAERYSKNSEEQALIRESVGRFASAFRFRSHSCLATDVNLLKWQMQWYVHRLESGVIPAKDEVTRILDMTATGRTENGLVATYFTIQERAHNYVNLLADGDGRITFARAAERHWSRLGSLIASDKSIAEAKARMEREGYRRATGTDFQRKVSDIYFPSQKDAFQSYFYVDWEGEGMPVTTSDGKEVYVKDGDWFTIGPANDNGVADVNDQAAVLPVAPLMMPTPIPIPAALPVGQPVPAL